MCRCDIGGCSLETPAGQGGNNNRVVSGGGTVQSSGSDDVLPSFSQLSLLLLRDPSDCWYSFPHPSMSQTHAEMLHGQHLSSHLMQIF